MQLVIFFNLTRNSVTRTRLRGHGPGATGGRWGAERAGIRQWKRGRTRHFRRRTMTPAGATSRQPRALRGWPGRRARLKEARRLTGARQTAPLPQAPDMSGIFTLAARPCARILAAYGAVRRYAADNFHVCHLAPYRDMCMMCARWHCVCVCACVCVQTARCGGALQRGMSDVDGVPAARAGRLIINVPFKRTAAVEELLVRCCLPRAREHCRRRGWSFLAISIGDEVHPFSANVYICVYICTYTYTCV